MARSSSRVTFTFASGTRCMVPTIWLNYRWKLGVRTRTLRSRRELPVGTNDRLKILSEYFDRCCFADSVSSDG